MRKHDAAGEAPVNATIHFVKSCQSSEQNPLWSRDTLNSLIRHYRDDRDDPDMIVRTLKTIEDYHRTMGKSWSTEFEQDGRTECEEWMKE